MHLSDLQYDATRPYRNHMVQTPTHWQSIRALNECHAFFCQCFVLLERTAKLMLHNGSSGLRASWGAKVRLKVTLTCLHHYSSRSFCQIVPLICSFPLFPCFAILKLLLHVVLQVSGGSQDTGKGEVHSALLQSRYLFCGDL